MFQVILNKIQVVDVFLTKFIKNGLDTCLGKLKFLLKKLILIFYFVIY